MKTVMKTRTKSPIRAISASIFTSSVALSFLACGQGNGGSTVITSAPPTVAGAKISSCVDTKLATQAKTVQGPETKVCRLVDGKMKDETTTALFSAAKKGKQIVLLQRAVFTVTYKNFDGDVIPLKEIPERNQAVDSNDIYVFLTKVCRPIAKTVFSRSHLVGNVVFRPKSADSVWAQPTLPGDSGNTSVDDLSDELFGAAVPAQAGGSELVAAQPLVRSKDSTEPTSPRGKRPVSPTYAIPSGFHTQLDFEMLIDGPLKQIKLADEVGALSSGSITLQSKPSEEQQQFCNQIVQRVGENFGLTKGRDCASRDTAAKASEKVSETTASGATSEKTAAASPGLTKVSEEEMLELVKPVCGSN